MSEIKDLGEFGLIKHLNRQNSTKHASTIKGVGDDGAVIQSESDVFVISTDMMVEGIHFDLMYSPLKHLGYKSVVTNLSDIFAMNATPKQITVSVAISSKYTVEAMDELYAGIYLACEKYKIDLIGGDTTSSPKGLVISITAIGQCPNDDVVYRNGAKIGDIICVTGDLGAAYLGLQILEREKRIFLENPEIQPELEKSQYLLERQLKPEAQIGAIEFFKEMKIKPTAMIDVSDGLASDLMHICEQSHVGAYIEEGKVPIHPDTERTALEFKLDPITCALHGGEDYELLFTIEPKDLDKVRYMPEVFIIGEITVPTEGLTLHTTGGNIHPLMAQGWNHFDSNQHQ